MIKLAGFFVFFIEPRLENREIPDKYISVYYEPMSEKQSDLNWLIAKRQEIGKKYFEGDEFDPELVRKEPFTFKKHPGYRLGCLEKYEICNRRRLSKLWLFGMKTKTAYIVDSSVYFPAGDKLPILVELYVISNSLEIK